MKRVFIFASILFVLTLALCACGDDKGGTYYPTNEEMQIKLANNGYEVEICGNINYHEFFVMFSSNIDGTLVEAVKDTEYIYFFRLTDSWRCDIVYDILEEKCKNYNSLVKIENDEKFGNIVYCGTEQAIKDAGIKIVDVKVEV
ncbi:MAG: hypothetical protein NC310_01355 [Roseburia sp.]|nr:hypothetical protein [Anaeroplasma bactoclasticum]MCM1195701.1 hypothetical protein [Roseburia sp.]MCM1556367.1 hypothetical protein [Anaeroplasma bactoclasticum]